MTIRSQFVAVALLFAIGGCHETLTPEPAQPAASSSARDTVTNEVSPKTNGTEASVRSEVKQQNTAGTPVSK